MDSIKYLLAERVQLETQKTAGSLSSTSKHTQAILILFFSVSFFLSIFLRNSRLNFPVDDGNFLSFSFYQWGTWAIWIENKSCISFSFSLFYIRLYGCAANDTFNQKFGISSNDLIIVSIRLFPSHKAFNKYKMKNSNLRKQK